MNKLKYLVPIGLVLMIGFLALLKAPYSAHEPAALAQKFISLVTDEKFDDAFVLTEEKSYVGSTIAEFKERAQHQLPLKSKDGIVTIKLISISPPQTYGNRLRRWVDHRPIEQDQLSFEFELLNNKGFLLFEVRLALVGKDKWKVSYFQSHAG